MFEQIGEEAMTFPEFADIRREMQKIEDERNALNSIPMIEMRGYMYLDVLFRLGKLHDRYQDLCGQWRDCVNPYGQKQH